ncbi:MAG: hypothetical protein AB1782_07345 [Cyanobacteriota bacterium]
MRKLPFKRNGNGNSLSQYTNVIVLIALALIPVFYVCGQLIIKNFSNFSSGLTPKNVSTNSTANNSGTVLTIKPNDLNGTPDKPVSKCSGGKCSIDYGSFVLNGIPQNFNEFVQTGGTSGGIDELADMIMQIAEHLKEIGDLDGYEEFKAFSNFAHIQADIVRLSEKQIQSNPDQTAFNDFYTTNGLLKDYKLPDELASELPNFSTNHAYFTILLDNCNIGESRNRKITNPDTYSNNYVNKAADSMIYLYDRIQNNTTKYPESIRNLAQELYLTLDDITTEAIAHIGAGANADPNWSCSFSYDPITGNKITPHPATTADLNAFLHPQYSLNEDITGSLICTAGKNTAEARSCH